MAPPDVGFSCPRCGAELRIPWAQRAGQVVCSGCSARHPFVDGILVLEEGDAAEDYPPSVYELLRRIEDRHFWFDARNRAIRAAMEDAGVRLSGEGILDIGCGTGFVLRALERAGAVVTGTDMYLAGLREARRRTEGLLVCARGAPSAGAFGIVLLADVIEHVEDDRELLRAARGVLAPGGHVVVTVPAHDLLWSDVDVASGHKRRYSQGSLARCLADSGLRPVLLRYFSHASAPLLLLQRTIRRSPRSRPGEAILDGALAVPIAPINAALALIARAEHAIRRAPIPFGGSLVAVAVAASGPS
ncbi:MAG: class I SAM-dependent methyltransferase [Elusimicrobia bacterium]|nr:class I SAM-dependent methyltransferase [Elusimicrobiota bacterium]